jgi:GT2 family glycosyltransferase
MEDTMNNAVGAGYGASSVPHVVIVVLNWNNYNDTKECLESVNDVMYPSFDVLVIDNGSTDGSGELIDDEFEWCDVTFTDENLGYSAGMNVGIEAALEGGADYALLLNNDTIVEPDFLSPLVETVETHDHVAMVSSIVRFFDSGDIQSAGRYFRPFNVRAPHFREPQAERPYEVDCVSGAVTLLNMEFIRQVGGLEEAYFIGPDDVELGLRAQRRGWRVMISPESEIYHKHAATATSGTPFRDYHSTRGRLHLASRYLSARTRIVFYALFLTRLVAKVAEWTAKRNRGMASANVRAFVDHLQEKPPTSSYGPPTLGEGDPK